MCLSQNLRKINFCLTGSYVNMNGDFAYNYDKFEFNIYFVNEKKGGGGPLKTASITIKESSQGEN